jgi:hypothetical protein
MPCVLGFKLNEIFVLHPIISDVFTLYGSQLIASIYELQDPKTWLVFTLKRIRLSTMEKKAKIRVAKILILINSKMTDA